MHIAATSPSKHRSARIYFTTPCPPPKTVQCRKLQLIPPTSILNHAECSYDAMAQSAPKPVETTTLTSKSHTTGPPTNPSTPAACSCMCDHGHTCQHHSLSQTLLLPTAAGTTPRQPNTEPQALPRLQKCCKTMRSIRILTHHNTAGVKVVVEGFALPQKLWRENEVRRIKLQTRLGRVAHRDG